MAAIGFAEITGDSSSATYDLNGWTGKATIEAGTGTDTLTVRAIATNASLTDTALTIGTAQIGTLKDFENAILYGTSASQTFNVAGWTNTGSIFGVGGTDSLLDTDSGAFLMQGTTYTAPSKAVWTLDKVGVNLTGSNTRDSFAIRNWTGGAVAFNGVNGQDSLLVEANANITITPTLLTIGSIKSTINSASIDSLTLIGGASANTFTLTGWNKKTSIDGGAGKDVLVYAGDTDFLLTANQLVVGKGASSINSSPTGSIAFTLSKMETLTLTGGASANVFTMSGFAGTVNVNGGAGSDVYYLYLTAADALTVVLKDTGTGRTDKDSLYAYAATAVPTHSTSSRRITFMMSRLDYLNIETIQVLRGSM
jgi:hypothetical protein